MFVALTETPQVFMTIRLASHVQRDVFLNKNDRLRKLNLSPDFKVKTESHIPARVSRGVRRWDQWLLCVAVTSETETGMLCRPPSPCTLEAGRVLLQREVNNRVRLREAAKQREEDQTEGTHKRGCRDRQM